jgi:hypothetical protein
MAEDVLSKIRGDELGRAVLTLPPIETTDATTVEAEFDAANVGRVRVVFRKFRKHHRTSSVFWLAESAERA